MASAKRRGSRSGKVSVPKTTWVCAVSRSSRREQAPLRGHRRDRPPGELARVALEPALAVQRLEKPRVIQVAGGGDDAVAAVVAGLVQAAEIVGRDAGQRVRGTQNGIAVGMIGPERRGMELEDEIVRSVRHPVDLLQDHVPLGLEVALAKQRPADQIGEDVDREGKIGVEHVRLVAGGVAARCRRRGCRRAPRAPAPGRARCAARCP